MMCTYQLGPCAGISVHAAADVLDQSISSGLTSPRARRAVRRHRCAVLMWLGTGLRGVPGRVTGSSLRRTGVFGGAPVLPRSSLMYPHMPWRPIRMILLRGSRPDTPGVLSAKNMKDQPGTAPFQLGQLGRKAKQKRSTALGGPRQWNRDPRTKRRPRLWSARPFSWHIARFVLDVRNNRSQYRSRNSGSTGFSNSEASRVTIVSPDGVTK